MKRLLLLLLALALPLSACAKTEARIALDAFLEAAKADDLDGTEALLFLTDDEREIYFYGLSIESLGACRLLQSVSDVYGAYLASALERTKLSVESLVEQGDHATATLTGSLVDLGDFVARTMPRIREELVLQALNGKDIPLSLAANIVLTRMIAEEEFPLTPATLILELERIDGRWLVLPSPAVTTLTTLDLYTDAESVFSAFEAE